MSIPTKHFLSRRFASFNHFEEIEYVCRAFEILDPNMANGKEKSANDVENFSQNLYVECAEKAISVRKIYSKLEL